MKWYLDYKPYLLTDDDWSLFRSRKFINIAGVDKLGRPVVIIKVFNFVKNDWNVKDMTLCTLGMLHHLERICDNMCEDGKYTIIVD